MAEEFLDEVILKAKREKKREELNQYILHGDTLPDELLQTICIGQGMAEIKLPVGLEPMAKELVDMKFQFDPQPQMVLTNLGGNVNFTISLLDISISGEELSTCVEESMEGLRRYFASIVFYEKGLEEIHGIDVCWFSYTSNSQDGCKIYNVVFYAATEKTLVITMNCRYEQMEKWDAIAKICLKSLIGKEYNG